MDVGRCVYFGLSLKQLGCVGEIGVGIVGDDVGIGIVLYLGVVCFGQDQCCCLGLVGLCMEFGIGKESDVVGIGGIQWCDVIDCDGCIIFQLIVQVFDQLLQLNIYFGFFEWQVLFGLWQNKGCFEGSF